MVICQDRKGDGNWGPRDSGSLGSKGGTQREDGSSSQELPLMALSLSLWTIPAAESKFSGHLPQGLPIQLVHRPHPSQGPWPTETLTP